MNTKERLEFYLRKKIPRIPGKLRRMVPWLFPENTISEKPFLIDTEEDVIREVKKPVPTEHERKMVEIIVIKYKEPEVEAVCASHLIKNTQWPFKMTFYDNRGGTKNMSKIWNKLIRESTCDYVMFMDPDAFVPRLEPCWLSRLMEQFDDPECYVVVPKVSRTSSKEQLGVAEDAPPRKLKGEFAAQCVLYDRKIFEKIGYFDEDFLFYGQDTEWSLRLIHKGFFVYLRPDVSVEHFKHYSMNKANERREVNLAVENAYANRILKEKTR
ncbi:MAG: glycosyltransferase [Patescibacteria group bacterium]|mgnify:CR=1 FL=1